MDATKEYIEMNLDSHQNENTDIKAYPQQCPLPTNFTCVARPLQTEAKNISQANTDLLCIVTVVDVSLGDLRCLYHHWDF